MRDLVVPAGAVDVAPVLDIGRMTGELAWIAEDGTVGWSGDQARTVVQNTHGQPVWSRTGPGWSRWPTSSSPRCIETP